MKVNLDNIIVRDLVDFLIIYCIREKYVFTVKDTGRDIVHYLLENNDESNAAIVEYIAKLYNVDRELIKDDIVNFLSELSDTGFFIQENREKVSSNTIMDNTDVEGEIIAEYRKRNKIFSATLEMTYSCNEQCVHCYALDKEYSKKNVVLLLEQWKNVIDELKSMDCIIINFTGGDPFVYPYFIEVLSYARRNNFLCNIYTNGQYLYDNSDIISYLSSLGIRTIYMSLYGSNAYVHDSVTDIKGSFQKTIDVAKKLIDKNISVVFQIMVMTINYHDYDDIIELVEKIGAEYRVGFSIINTNNGSDEPQKFFIDNSEAIKNIMIKAGNRFSFMDGDMVLSNDEYDSICGAGETALSISPDGVVYPCVSLKYSLGRLNSKSLKEIWYGRLRKLLLEKLKWKNTLQCCDCKYMEYCPHCVGISYAENHDMLKCNHVDKTLGDAFYKIKNSI